MLLETWGVVLTKSFQDIWLGIANFVPMLVIAVVIFVVGWFVGVLLGRVIAQIVRSIKVDSALKTAGVEGLLAKGGFRLDSGRFIGELVKWFVIVVFLVATLEVLGLRQVNLFLQDVVLTFIPNVIVAVLILLVGAVVADAVQKLVVGAARAAEVQIAHFLGGLVRWSIWIFAILIALSQLGIANFFAQTLFTGVVVALSLAVGLSFGLGGQESAARFLERLRKDISRN